MDSALEEKTLELHKALRELLTEAKRLEAESYGAVELSARIERRAIDALTDLGDAFIAAA